MFAQLIMLSTIILLFLVGSRVFRQSKKTNYSSGKILSLGLLLTAFGIFIYAVRDILTQFKLYELELMVGKTGVFFHTLGGVLILRFFIQTFASERLKKICFLICLTLIIFVLIALTSLPLISETVGAPFEPFPYQIRKHSPDGLSVGLVLFIFILGPLLLASIIFYNATKIKEKELKTKALFYGIGFLFLFIPSLICLFISPIYARWGYLLGSIFIYKAFNVKT